MYCWWYLSTTVPLADQDKANKQLGERLLRGIDHGILRPGEKPTKIVPHVYTGGKGIQREVVDTKTGETIEVLMNAGRMETVRRGLGTLHVRVSGMTRYDQRQMDILVGRATESCTIMMVTG